MGASEPLCFICPRGCGVSLTVATVFSGVFVVVFAGARAVLPITFEMRGSVLVFMVGAAMVPFTQVKSASSVEEVVLCFLVVLMVAVAVVGFNVLGIPEPRYVRYWLIQKMVPDDWFTEREREGVLRVRANAYVGK